MSAQYRTAISDEKLHELYLQHGRDASKLAPIFGCAPSTIRTRVRKMLARVEAHPIAEPRDPELINRVAELLQRSNVDPNTIQRIRGLKLKSYGIAIKNAEGRIETEGLYSTSFQADPIVNADDNPCLTQAPPITVLYSPQEAPRILRRVVTNTIISDAQIGFMRNRDGTLEEIHDPRAINVMQQIVAAERPTRNIWIGDVADLTQFSRWAQRKEFEGCAQISIDEASRILGETHSALGSQCEIDIVIGGNHDARIQLHADERARELSGIKRAGALPSEWSVNSLPFLARFDEIGIQFSGSYPGGTYWLLDDLCAMHAPPKKLEIQGSVVHGHTHHLTMTTTAAHGRHGRVNYFVYDVGCLCHTGHRDDPQSLVILKTPSDRPRSDWAQGIAVVDIIEGKAPKHQVTLTKIENGHAIHRGQTFVAAGLELDAA